MTMNLGKIDLRLSTPLTTATLPITRKPKCRSYTILGIHIDVCSKLARANFSLRRVSNFVPIKTLRTLYFSMFHPHLLYCSTIVSCAPQTSLNRISTLQKKAIRIITKSKALTHTPPPYSLTPTSSLLKNSSS